MSLKEIAFNRVIKHIIGCPNKTNRSVLICDDYGLAVISSICKMKDIIDNGVISVEILMKNRQPLKMDAIYFVAPTEANIKRIIKDFEPPTSALYTAAHIFCTSHLAQPLIDMIKNSDLIRRLKTLSETYVDYFIQEKNVFTMDSKVIDSYNILYSSNSSKDLNWYIDKLGEQLASICITLNCKPSIICQKNSENCCNLVNIISEKLKFFDVLSNTEITPKPTTLLILDRCFDGITPLMHELTLQAMAADMLNLTENVYVYKNLNGVETTSFLDESNEMWSQVAHKHIADILQLIPSKIKELASQNKMKLPNNKGSLSDLKVMLSKLPQYKAELNRYQVLLNLTESCYKQFETRKLENLCAIEQDIATGTDKTGVQVVDPIAHMLPILQGDYSVEEKLRVILLYALSKNDGIPQDNLDRIIEHGNLKNDKSIFSKFNKMNLKVMESDDMSKSLNRPQEYIEGGYSLSRFIPPLKKIMKEIISKNYSNKEFIEVVAQSNSDDSAKASNSASTNRFQFGKWKQDGNSKAVKSNATRFIVFILGGVTFSEIRCSYEIGQEYNCDTIIGGTQLVTPDIFLKNVSKL